MFIYFFAFAFKKEEELRKKNIYRSKKKEAPFCWLFEWCEINAWFKQIIKVYFAFFSSIENWKKIKTLCHFFLIFYFQRKLNFKEVIIIEQDSWILLSKAKRDCMRFTKVGFVLWKFYINFFVFCINYKVKAKFKS